MRLRKDRVLRILVRRLFCGFHGKARHPTAVMIHSAATETAANVFISQILLQRITLGAKVCSVLYPRPDIAPPNPRPDGVAGYPPPGLLLQSTPPRSTHPRVSVTVDRTVRVVLFPALMGWTVFRRAKFTKIHTGGGGARHRRHGSRPPAAVDLQCPLRRTLISADPLLRHGDWPSCGMILEPGKTPLPKAQCPRQGRTPSSLLASAIRPAVP